MYGVYVHVCIRELAHARTFVHKHVCIRIYTHTDRYIRVCVCACARMCVTLSDTFDVFNLNYCDITVAANSSKTVRHDGGWKIER